MLRASWGQNGNCNISAFQYLATISLNSSYYFDDKSAPAIGATFSHNSNMVTRLANSEGILHGPENAIAQNTAELYRVQVGYPIGYFWGYQMDGIIQNEQQKQDYLNKYFGGDAGKSLKAIRWNDLRRWGEVDEIVKNQVGNKILNEQATGEYAFTVDFMKRYNETKGDLPYKFK